MASEWDWHYGKNSLMTVLNGPPLISTQKSECQAGAEEPLGPAVSHSTDSAAQPAGIISSNDDFAFTNVRASGMGRTLYTHSKDLHIHVHIQVHVQEKNITPGN